MYLSDCRGLSWGMWDRVSDQELNLAPCIGEYEVPPPGSPLTGGGTHRDDQMSLS